MNLNDMKKLYRSAIACAMALFLAEAMDRWIKGMMEVTATRVSAWDAVNESVSGRDANGDGFYELG
jgi:GH35 family endo-1,4-beta-xylanase